MKIKQDYFVENSSTVYAIIIPKENVELEISKEVNIYNENFTSDFRIIYDTNTKLSFIVIGMKLLQMDNELKKLYNLLNNLGIEIKNIENIEGNIENYDMLSELLFELINDEKKLKKFLFSKSSFLIIGNVNDESYDFILIFLEFQDFWDILTKKINKE